ncbi:hypothetical protein A9196_20930 [Aeromonas dhakensis]|nr:hypothetical protein A9196_20930 [Aeromonas dhakensis]
MASHFGCHYGCNCGLQQLGGTGKSFDAPGNKLLATGKWLALCTFAEPCVGPRQTLLSTEQPLGMGLDLNDAVLAEFSQGCPRQLA